jgi:hypothetical protein
LPFVGEGSDWLFLCCFFTAEAGQLSSAFGIRADIAI